MNRNSIFIAVVVLLLLAGGAVFAMSYQSQQESTSINNGTETADETPVAQSSQDVAVNGDNVTITFNDAGFTPADVTVKKGTKVSVVNNSDRDVEFSSDEHPTHRNNPEMNLEMLAPGESASFTAETVGAHPYHDHLDPSQTGTIVVTE